MIRSAVTELHYIAPVVNLASIMRLGLLCHSRAAAVEHNSVANAEVQTIRADKLINGKQLHSFVNLYFHARNPMMYVRCGRHAELCVLRISPDVLDLAGTLVSDRNCASAALVQPSTLGLDHLDAGLVFAERWDTAEPPGYHARKAIRCAEVLVPDRLPFAFVMGAYVSNPATKSTLEGLEFPCPIVVDAHMFFQCPARPT